MKKGKYRNKINTLEKLRTKDILLTLSILRTRISMLAKFQEDKYSMQQKDVVKATMPAVCSNNRK
jgi:hypothetical protein